jgi:hypothetical protein
MSVPESELPPAQFYSQTLDHFDATNLYATFRRATARLDLLYCVLSGRFRARFPQRYFVNASFFEGAASGAPVFLSTQRPPLFPAPRHAFRLLPAHTADD